MEILSPEKDKSNDFSSEEAFSLRRRSIRSATEGGTLRMNCSSMACIHKLQNNVYINVYPKSID